VGICSRERLFELRAGWSFGVQAGNESCIDSPQSQSRLGLHTTLKRLDPGSNHPTKPLRALAGTPVGRDDTFLVWFGLFQGWTLVLILFF